MRRSILLSTAILLAGSAEFCHAAGAERIHLDPAKTVAQITPVLWGTNILSWIDTEAAVDKGNIAPLLKGMNAGLLRFPGGTAAQNYDWRTNRWINPGIWPFTDASPLSTDQFMVLCRQVGAEPDIVVNVGTWALKDDIEAGAREAAAWVHYCNKEKGYAVKYWEIGNENYFATGRSAKDYAECVNVYARAMKQVDPTIQVGVDGPWSTDIYGTGDMVPPPLRDFILDYEARITTKAQALLLKTAHGTLAHTAMGGGIKKANEGDTSAVTALFADYAKRATPTQAPLLQGAQNAMKKFPFKYETFSQPWWKTVVPICGGNVDTVIIHTYYPDTRMQQNVDEFIKIQGMFARQYPGKKYNWFYSEFNNVPQKGTTEATRALTNMELWLRLANHGMNMATEWAFRETLGSFAPLVNLANDQPRPHYTVLQAIDRNMRGHFVAASSSTSNFPVFASVDGNRLVVALFSTHQTDPQIIQLDSSQPLGGTIKVTAWTANAAGDDYVMQPISFAKNSDGISFAMPPQSLVLAVVTSGAAKN